MAAKRGPGRVASVPVRPKGPAKPIRGRGAPRAPVRAASGGPDLGKFLNEVGANIGRIFPAGRNRTLDPTQQGYSGNPLKPRK